MASNASATATIRASSGICFAGQAVRIASAVPLLVMVQHDRQHFVELLDVAREFGSRFRRGS